MPLPDFVVIGAQKAGTTSLWHYLGQHPSIFVAGMKETDFFIAERNWPRGLAWYEARFAEGASTGARVIGEASPNYTMFPSWAGVPERMAGVIPEARLIYLLRDPVERMRSSYLHALAMGNETLPIAEALITRGHFANTSRYALQIEQYLRHFDRSQLLLLLADDLAARPGETLDRVLEFLGLPAGWRPESFGRRHESASKRVPRPWALRLGDLLFRVRLPEWTGPPLERLRETRLMTRPMAPRDADLSDDLRYRLEDLMRPDVERLREYLGPGFDGWGLLR